MNAPLVLLALAAAQASGLQVETESRRFSCSQPGSGTILGSVVEASGPTFVLDQCLPTQDCQKVVRAAVSVSAPGFVGFERYLVKDGFVRVQFDVRMVGDQCQARVTVSGLGEWLGAPNPARDSNRFYFSSASQTTEALADAPFTVERCPHGKPALRLRRRAGTAIHDAAQGLSPWQAGGPDVWTVDLQTRGTCASDVGWGFWVSGRPR